MCRAYFSESDEAIATQELHTGKELLPLMKGSRLRELVNFSTEQIAPKNLWPARHSTVL